MRLAKGLILENEATFGKLEFSDFRRDKKVIEDGQETSEIKERTYDLQSTGLSDTIQVSIPASAGEKNFDYEEEVELVNPTAGTVATATFQGADVKWYFKADDIISKKSKPHFNQKKDNPHE